VGSVVERRVESVNEASADDQKLKPRQVVYNILMKYLFRDYGLLLLDFAAIGL